MNKMINNSRSQSVLYEYILFSKSKSYQHPQIIINQFKTLTIFLICYQFSIKYELLLIKIIRITI